MARRVRLYVGVAALATVLAACSSQTAVVEARDGVPPSANPAPDLSRKVLVPIPAAEQGLGLSGEARLPDNSAKDWVTYADHVVAATVVAEVDGQPTPEELEVGEGMYGRDVTLRVDDVLWSRDEPRQPAPSRFEWSAAGWAFNDHRPDARFAFSRSDSPRMELGHTYVMALAWEEARCSEGDPMQPAQWMGLGSDSTIPFDDGVLGDGDVGGRLQDASLTKANLASKRYHSLEDRMLTRGADDLRAALNSAKPGKVVQYHRPAPCDGPSLSSYAG